MRGLIGKKLGMTQIFDDSGRVIPVTVIEAGPCVVTQIKTEKRDGYNAIQVGFSDKKVKHTTKPLQGHFAKAGTTPKYALAEFEGVSGFEYKLGQQFNVNIFHEGETVNATGTSKGKGFAGVIKRHGFHRQPVTHGQSEYLRHPGSIGQSSDPSRVWKGMKMAGHMGVDRVTVSNLKVVRVDPDNNQLFLRGAVPGVNNGIIIITK
ncbi:MAG: 50S ribosomal protein L3 [Candidatus Neomarinimicrobiota bacterium]